MAVVRLDRTLHHPLAQNVVIRVNRLVKMAEAEELVAVAEVQVAAVAAAVGPHHLAEVVRVAVAEQSWAFRPHPALKTS